MNPEIWQRVRVAFSEASGLDAANRRQFLSQLYSTDPETAPHVEGMLMAEVADSFLSPFLERESISRQQAFSPTQELATRFQILELVGSGGSGEVYRAFDRHRGCDVALKTLRPSLFSDRDAVDVLRNEVNMATRVSHHNVCRLFDITASGTSDGPVFISMEFLEGETLYSRLKRGPIEIPLARMILEQIVAGLSAAHGHGVLHRDLKPGNVMLSKTRDGDLRVVLMDFGLAREVRPGDDYRTAFSTEIVVGTPHYMAPEQLLGKRATRLSDIHALGVIMFEMVVGRLPFEGTTAIAIASARLNGRAPRLRSVVGNIDSSWEYATAKCLEREPERRPGSAEEVLRLVSRRPPYQLQGRTLAALSIMLVLAFAYWRIISPGAGTGTEARTQQPRTEGITRLTTDKGLSTDPSASIGGTLLVYASDRGPRGDLNIWMQRLDTGETTQLTDDPGNEDEPAISPNGKLIAYHSQRYEALFLKALPDGPPRNLARWGENPQFSPDGSKVVFWTGIEGENSELSGRIWMASTSGGDLARFAPEFVDARYPAWSPDGRQILFRGVSAATPSPDTDSEWWIKDATGGLAISTGAWKRFRAMGLMPFDSPFAWIGDQVVFTARAGHTTNLWRAGMPASRRAVVSNPERLTTSTEIEIAPAPLPDGRVAYANWRFGAHIWRISISGESISQVTDGDLTDAAPSVSRDGHLLAFGRRLGNARDIWWKDLRTGSEKSFSVSDFALPYLSPDGRKIAWSLGGDAYTYVIDSGARSVVCRACGQVTGWLTGSDQLLLLSPSTSASGSLNAVSTDAPGKSLRRILSAAALHNAVVSPDGKAIAFSTRQAGSFPRLYLTRLDKLPSESPWISVTPPDSWADNPAWSDDGHDLLYSSERDGFQCVWRQRLDPRTLQPSGAPSAVYHFHRADFSQKFISPLTTAITLSGDSLFLAVAKLQGNLWAIRP